MGRRCTLLFAIYPPDAKWTFTQKVAGVDKTLSVSIQTFAPTPRWRTSGQRDSANGP